MNRLIYLVPVFLWSMEVQAQQTLNLKTVTDKLEKDGKVVLNQGKTELLTYTFQHDGDTVDAIAFKPVAEGKYPGVLLIPGYSRTAADYIPLGLRLAREGYACLAITPRGFGKSTGKADFVGPQTMAAVEAGFHRFRKENYVDANRMGIFGYSRGAMAASLLATRLKTGEVQAAVFAAGIYDFKKAYEEVTLEGIKKNMENEAGTGETAFKERSSVHQMEKLPCPVLILHGEKDVNAPVSQAFLLRDKLTGLKKPFEIKTFPEKDHDIGRQNLNDNTIEFFNRMLKSGK